MVQKNLKRKKLAEKYKQKRTDLLAVANDKKLKPSERQAARLALQYIPRDANPNRYRRRCVKTGRPRGVYRYFGVGRQVLREWAMFGLIPGLKKSSW